MAALRFALACAAMIAWPTAGSGQLYEEDFDVDPTAAWTVNDPGLSDILVDFFYDYSSIGVPPAPNGTGTRGLKMTANNTDNVFSGFSVSPTGESFTGNYRVSFDLWQNYTGPLGDGVQTTQLSMFGVGTAGDVAVWAGSNPKESVTFAVTLDGGSAADYRAYSSAAPISYPAADPVYLAPGGANNGSDAYYAGFGGEAAPAAQVLLFPGQTDTTGAGELAFAWRRLAIEVVDDQATWFVDDLPIASVDLTTVTLGGSNILFGHGDTNTSSSSDANDTALNVTLIDNVRVDPIADFFTVAPCRLLDTRQPAQGPALSSGVPRVLTVPPSCDIPATARSLALNVTVLGATGDGHLTVYQADVAVPDPETIHFAAGQVRANNAIVALAGDDSGEIAFHAVVRGGGTVEVIVDVNGYFE